MSGDLQAKDGTQSYRDTRLHGFTGAVGPISPQARLERSGELPTSSTCPDQIHHAVPTAMGLLQEAKIGQVFLKIL